MRVGSGDNKNQVRNAGCIWAATGGRECRQTPKIIKIIKGKVMAMVTQYNASYEEDSDRRYHSRGYITDDGEFVETSKETLHVR